MRRIGGLVGAVALLAGSLALIGGALTAIPAAATTDHVGVTTEYGANLGLTPVEVAAGPDGNLWYTGGSGIYRVTPSGTVTVFPVGSGTPYGITAGPDGNLWFTESLPRYVSGVFIGYAPGGFIGRLTPSGTLTEFPTTYTPKSITAGPDGNLWFTEGTGGRTLGVGVFVSGRIGRMTPSGTLTEFPVNNQFDSIWGITAGPDGNLWFTEPADQSCGLSCTGSGAEIGRITPSGTETDFADSGNPEGITAGPDGNLWFTDAAGGGSVGQITPSGTQTEFGVRITAPDIAAGPDGNLWFFGGPGGIADITPSGTISNFDAPAGDVVSSCHNGAYPGAPPVCSSGPAPLSGLAPGPDGDMWFGEPQVALVGKIGTAPGPPLAPDPPPAPFALAANAQATVNFGAPAFDGGSPITGLTVTASPGGQTCSWTSGPTSCTFTGLTNGTSYTFTVVATNAVGSSLPSIASGYVVPVAPPDAPTGVTAVPGFEQATVSWSAASDGGAPVTQWVVFVSPGGQGTTCQNALSGPLTCTIIGLTAGTPYTFTVMAANALGDGPKSDPSAPVIPFGPPGAPQNVVGVGANTQVTVSWSAPAFDGASPITEYRVTAAPGGQQCVWQSGDGPLSCTVPSLTNGTPYTFTVVAGNMYDQGPASSPSAPVTPTTTVPGAPSNVTGVPNSGQVTVSWFGALDGGSPIIGYTVTASPGGQTCSGSPALQSCTVTGLANGTSYTFTVVATNAIGPGPASVPSAPVTPAATVPGVPQGVAVFNGHAQVTVTWSAPASDGGSPITGYTVTASPGGAQCMWSSPGPLSCTVSGLTNGTPYTFTVLATNTVGSGPTSGPSAPVTPHGVPGAPSGVTGAPGKSQVVVSWSAPTNNGGSPITGYTATASPGGATCSWSSGPLSCTVTGLTDGTPYTFSVTATTTNGPGSASTASVPVIPGAGTFTSLAPSRILDTRPGGGHVGPLTTFAEGQSQNLPVLNVGGVPANHVEAVLLNVTATNTTGFGWLTLYPADASAPTASNLNFAAGQSVPNLVAVKVAQTGPNAGHVTITQTGGFTGSTTADVIADVVGYYADGTTTLAGQFTGVTPTRIMDTRPGGMHVGTPTTFTQGGSQNLTAGGAGGVPANADSVVMNVTATGSNSAGWLTLYPQGNTLPTASNLNFAAGQSVANLVTVKLGTAGGVTITDTGGTSGAGVVDAIADVVGYYKSGSPGSLLTSIAPQRILDTRNGTGGTTGPVNPQGTVTVDPHTAPGLPPAGSYTGVIVNVTATSPSAGGWLTVYPSDASLPTASNLNFAPGNTVANLVKVKVGADGKIKITNTGGVTGGPQVQIIADIVGYYTSS